MPVYLFVLYIYSIMYYDTNVSYESVLQ